MEHSQGIYSLLRKEHEMDREGEILQITHAKTPWVHHSRGKIGET